MSEKSRKEVGRRYEKVAAKCLQAEGYEILERNFFCRQGEIDLIAREGEFLVFVEVKYRRDLSQGDPMEAVDERKRRRIARAASYYLWKRGLSEDTPCRFDVVALLPGKYRICRDAFEVSRNLLTVGK